MRFLEEHYRRAPLVRAGTAGALRALASWAMLERLVERLGRTSGRLAAGAGQPRVGGAVQKPSR